MAWMIIKSAGDDHSFTVIRVPGEIGHTYRQACKLARTVTQAMKVEAQHNDLADRIWESVSNVLYHDVSEDTEESQFNRKLVLAEIRNILKAG